MVSILKRGRREELLDIFVMGCRSFDVDIPAFRRITEGTHISNSTRASTTTMPQMAINGPPLR